MSESQDKIFIFCEPGTENSMLPVFISLPVGLLTASVLSILGKVFRSSSVSPPGSRIEAVLCITTTVAAVLGSIAFLYESSLEFGSLINCSSPLPSTFSSFAVSRWITFLVHLYFMCRPFLAWTIHWHVQFLLTVVHVALFVQDIVALVINQQLIAFHFLIVFSFHCHEVEDTLSRLAKRIFPRYEEIVKVICHLWLVTVLLAGCLRAAEEWNTNRGLHPTHEGSLVPMRTVWSYIYWTIITLSSVGYGDLSPSTSAGRAVIVIMIILFLTWFSTHFSTLTDLLSAMRKVFTSKDSFDLEENQFRHLVIGCGSEYQLISFLKQFPKQEHENLLAFVDSKNSHDSVIDNQFDIATYRSSDPLEVIKIYGFSLKDSVFIHLNHENPVQLDKLTVNLVRKIKDSGCVARLFVHVTNDRSRTLIGRINYWRSDGTDVCISSQPLTSHMLVLSAHSRLIPALIASAANKELITVHDESAYTIMKFSAAAMTEYLQNGRILLGAISNKDGALLLPDTLESDWLRVVLVTGQEDARSKNNKPNLQPLITTTPISADVSVVGTVSDSMKVALASHPFLRLTKKLPKVYIYESELLTSQEGNYGLLKAKQELVDGEFVSTLEHRYEACQSKDCVCGTFENSHLSTALLAVASRDPRLYDIWMQIIEGDRLVVEQVEADCYYEDLFKTMVEKYQRVPIGVEITQMVSKDHALRMPKLNPSSGLQVQKGDLVVCIRA